MTLPGFYALQHDDPSWPNFTPVGYAMRCKTTGEMHPFTAFDEAKAKRMAAFRGKHIRVSPDLCHMLIGGHDEYQIPITLDCDPTLPPDTIVSPS